MKPMLIASLAALLPVAAASANPYGDVSVDLAVQRVPKSSVYYLVGRSGIPGPENEGLTSNAGLVITTGGVVVYDALGTPALGYELLRAIRQLTREPVEVVVAGHFHADHIYGLQAFREHTDAEIWAHASALDYLADPDAERRLAQRREALAPWVNAQTYVVEPDKLYTDRTSFEVGDTTFELIHAGPAHSPGDTIMVVPKEGVIFAGDIIFAGRLPFLGDSAVDTDSWLAALETLAEMDPAPRIVIPGHGEPFTDARAAIGFTTDYIRFLREHMGAAVEDLEPFDQAYAQTDWSAYADLPAFEQTNRRNAYSVYLEMEAESF